MKIHDAPGARGPPERLHRRPGAGEEDGGRRLVVNHYKRVRGGELGDPDPEEVEVSETLTISSLIGPTGCGKTALAQTLAPPAARPVRHQRRHHLDRGRICRRGRRKPDSQARYGRRLPGPRRRRASSTSMRSTRSTRPTRTSRSPATCRARACSRPCSNCSRGPSPTFRRRGVESTRNSSTAQVNYLRHPLHLRRFLRRPRRDHRQTRAGPEDDRLRPLVTMRLMGASSRARLSWWPRSPPKTSSGTA